MNVWEDNWDDDTTAHLAAVPGIAMEGYTALVKTLLEPDLRTFRRA